MLHYIDAWPAARMNTASQAIASGNEYRGTVAKTYGYDKLDRLTRYSKRRVRAAHAELASNNTLVTNNTPGPAPCLPRGNTCLGRQYPCASWHSSM